MSLTDLPDDLFILILAYLSPKDLIRSRRVSTNFNAAFTNPDVNRQLLVHHYPRARREPRLEEEGEWAKLFQKVACRYHHLTEGRPRAFEKFPLAKSFILPAWARYYPIAPWKRHLQFDDKTAPFQHPDTLWTYDWGILIFPSTEIKQYTLYDLDAGKMVVIDISSESKIVRRIRLKDKVLIVEWSEQQSYHQLNENETVYRHFATAYDVIWGQASETWNIVFRNEWKIHFLGIPLNNRDRFFSTHDSKHYAMYLWQPNRSAWGEDEPIEALAVWDISSPSPYRPSEDPSGCFKPDTTTTTKTTTPPLSGPQVIMRLSFADLDFYEIRQRETPNFDHLALDEGHVYVIEENHRWMAGDQASYTLPKLHEVKTIGIPFNGGPRWVSVCGVDGNDGAESFSYCGKISGRREPQLSPCWRHEEYPYLTVTEAVDTEAGVIFSARQCFMLGTVSINIKPKSACVRGHEVSLRDEYWEHLLAKGKICGDERWLIGENASNEVVILRFDKRPQNVKK